MCREAACLGDRVVLFSPHPGRIREQFKIDLPRPRDINSASLANYSSEITRALKSHEGTEKWPTDSMKRVFTAAVFFIVMIAIWHFGREHMVATKRWSPVLVPSPAQCLAVFCQRGRRRHPAGRAQGDGETIAAWLLRGRDHRRAAGIIDGAFSAG
jgi:hypothetical protein